MDTAIKFFKNKYVYLSVLIFIIFLKNVLFIRYAYGYFFPCRITDDIPRIVLLYWSKFSSALFISCFVLIIRKRYLFYILLFFIDIWIMSNLLYFRNNNLLIDTHVILMIGNLRGFTDSILSLIDYKVFMFPLLTLAFVLYDCFFKISFKPDYKLFFINIALFFLIIRPISNISELRDKSGTDCSVGCKIADLFIPFHCLFSMKDYLPWQPMHPYYIEKHSVIDYFPATFVSDLLYPKFRVSHINVSLQDKQSPEYIYSFRKVTSDTSSTHPDIIIFLVESFESWLLNDSTYLPNIKKFIHDNNCLCYPRMFSQIKYGNSGDGQLTTNTGLLPISCGAACNDYGSNVFPNFAHFYPNSFIINQNIYVWNQQITTLSYGYQSQVMDSVVINDGSDKDIFECLNRVCDTIGDPFCLQVITGSTHIPFISGENNRLKLSDKNCGKQINKFINAFNYTDSCFSIFFKKFKQDRRLQNSIIIITGDHTVFNGGNMKDEFLDYSEKRNYELQNYVPFIVYSPDFSNCVIKNDIAYQMDIFPTILHLINAQNYYFKGFGVDLLDSCATKKRSVMPDKAYLLSNKFIRTDYFKQFKDSL